MLTFNELWQLKRLGYFPEAELLCERLTNDHKGVPGTGGPFYYPLGDRSWVTAYGRDVKLHEYADPMRRLGYRVLIHTGWLDFATGEFHAIPERTRDAESDNAERDAAAHAG
jgi:hypothetical protein